MSSDILDQQMEVIINLLTQRSHKHFLSSALPETIWALDIEKLYSTVQYSTVQYSTVQYSTVQYSTVQYSTVQYSTVQYSTV